MAISIKEPCHEDWSKMTPTQRGAFCQVCTKEVIDFTDKSPIQIKSIFAKEFAENKTPCARITNFQLDQINDDFFKWKSDSQAFRAVWIFSLIAVFGFSLFSCSSTPTKELVGQLNIETNVMLDSLENRDSLLAESDAFDSLPVTFQGDSSNVVTDVPWILPEQPHGGTSPWDPQIISKLDWKITCVNWETVIYGDFHIPETEEDSLNEFLKAETNPTSNLHPTFTIPVLPVPPQPAPTPTSPKLEAISSSGDKKFSAFIYPNPIVKSSRLYIDVSEYVELTISVFEKNSVSAIQSGRESFGFGHYEVDPKLFDLKHGEYQLRLENVGQVSLLDFVV